MARVEIAIPRRPAYVRVVRLALASLARSTGMEEEAIEDLKIAVGEACANAVVSMPEDAAEERVSITWNDEPKRIVVEVGQRIPGEETSVDSPDAVDSGGFSTRAVMSTALLDTLVDECSVVRSRGGRVYTRLVVNRSAGI